MLIFKEVETNLLESSSIALGVFDGVHLGHVKVIHNAIEQAKKCNTVSCVVTFSNYPQDVLDNALKPQVITPINKKLELFQDLGVGAVLLLEFSKEFMELSAEQYLRGVLINSLNPKAITTGFNHHFGANQKGNTQLLESYSEKFGYQLSTVPPVELDGEVVSSSAIRKCILNGDMVKASEFLGRDFSLECIVTEGSKKGFDLGFPTANIENIPIDIASGVYSGWVKIHNKKYKSAINIGSAPTIKGGKKLIEAHILHFSKNIYGETIEVGFSQKLRDEKKFASTDELIEQIKKDCALI